jgi:predicted transcriptional regulator of viral defense system
MLSNPTLAKGRLQLSRVLQRSGDLVSVADASDALGVDRRRAARLLSRWRAQGWLRRLRRGIYAPVPLTALGQDQVLEDPWVVVPELFGPAYVGGWSAAEHWGLTEQVFRGACVLTRRPVREKEVAIQGIPFALTHVGDRFMFGTRPVWRGQARVEVSDPAKTVVDMMSMPALGGGIRHAARCLDQFLADESAAADLLIAAADRLGNGAVFKRLGFLAERRGGPAGLIEACRGRLTAGNARLDPALPCPRLSKRWRLWLPLAWAPPRG